MTKEQLDAIRARLDAASPDILNKNRLCFGDCCRTKAEKEAIAHAPTDLRALLDEVERLGAAAIWEEDRVLRMVVDAHLRGAQEATEKAKAEVERLTTELHASQAEVVDLHADPLPAAAWVREVQQAAFRRGAEVMREAAARHFEERALQQHVAGDSIMAPVHEASAQRVRALPIPDAKP